MRKFHIGDKIRRISSNTTPYIIMGINKEYCNVQNLYSKEIKTYKYSSIVSNWCKVNK